MPRKVASLKRIVGELATGNYLTPDLILSLHAWQRGIDEKKFGANAQNHDEATLRTKVLLGNLRDADAIAAEWGNGRYDGVNQHSEAGIRCRLSSEIAWEMRTGGAELPDGSVRTDITQLVEEVAYQLRPELKAEVAAEKERREGRQPRMLEGGTPSL